MQQLINRKILSKLFISLIPVVALFQVSFFMYTMKWDMMNYFLPTRHFLSECFSNHIMPFWCPYIHMGFPIYADPQAGLWYPVDLFLALTTGYNVYVVQAEYILHLVIAGIGLYKLLKTLDISETPAMIVAALFPLCGFFISHASHPTLIISMAWIPFVFHFFIKGFEEKKYYRFLQTGVALALCITGGYLVFAIITCYLLLFLFVYYTIKNRVEKGYIGNSVLWGAIMTATFLCLGSGYLFSLWQSLPYLNRSESLSLEIANINSFSPQCLLSFFFPFSTAANNPFYDTDMTMRNSYMGLFMLPLLVTGLCYGNRKRNALLLLAGLFFLAAAMGKYTPVRTWLYVAVPMMKIFRHAAILRAFTLLCFLVIAADGLHVLFTKISGAKKILIAALLLEGILVAGIFLYAAQHEDIRFRFPDFRSVISMAAFNAEGNLYKHWIVQAAMQGIVIGLALLLCLFTRQRTLAIGISVLWLTDVMLAAQLNVSGTVTSIVKDSAFNVAFHKLPKGFPVYNNVPTDHYNQYGGDALDPVVFNASIMRKEPCWDGFNPFCLRTYITFVTSPMTHYTFKEPVVFISGQLKPMSHYDGDLKNGMMDSSSIYAADSALPKNPGNFGGSGNAVLTRFDPGNVQVITNTGKPAFLTLLQSVYPGWTAGVDGRATEIIKTNDAFMSVILPPGRHEVSFNFNPPYFYLTAVLQWGGYLLLGLFFILKRKQHA